MKDYKYILDPSSKKFTCPACNKTTFVKYIDSETSNYLSETFGRCDRESNCSYHNAPEVGKLGYLVEFESYKAVSKKAIKVNDKTGNTHLIPISQIIETSGNNFWITEWFLVKNNLLYLSSESKLFYSDTATLINLVVIKDEVIKEPSYHELELVDLMYCDEAIEDNLTKYLRSIFSEDELFKALQNYLITGTHKPWNNSTVFWQMDHEEKVHGAKIMLYDALTGKRVKQPYNHINWLHKVLTEPNFVLNQCLFGLHRINEDQKAVIAIVESEKTAIIMSVIVPNVIWLATGSKQNLKLSLLESLRDRQIVLYPDKGEFNDWLNKAKPLIEAGFTIQVSNLLEATDFPKGFDLADYYLNGR